MKKRNIILLILVIIFLVNAFTGCSAETVPNSGHDVINANK